MWLKTPKRTSRIYVYMLMRIPPPKIMHLMLRDTVATRIPPKHLELSCMRVSEVIKKLPARADAKKPPEGGLKFY